MNRSNRRRGKNEKGDCIFAVRVRTSRDFGAIVEAGLHLSGLQPISWALADRDVAVLDLYAANEREGRALLARVKALVSSWEDGERWTVALRRLAREDWAESWKRFFKVERVSKRITVKPPWLRVASRPDQVVVEIEPGMSFGTGQHPTTRSCLRLLDGLAGKTTGSLLDLGCGSGILAIAGVKLGFGPVLAVDNDSVAVRIAKENAQRNGESANVSFRVADLASIRVSMRYDVVVANILAGVLVEYAQRIVRFMEHAKDSRLILSGILTPQYARVKSAYEGAGMEEVCRLRDGKWTSGCFRRGGARQVH
jgi:ribosomal protein L11 methyltransferase